MHLAPEELPRATDDALVRAAVAAQREAFTELVMRYTDGLLWFVRERVHDPVEAEEITQEAMVRAFESLPRLRVPRAFWSWLLTVASSIISDRRKAESKLIHLGEEEEEALAGAVSPDPSTRLTGEEVRARLVEEMKKLAPRYRQVLALKYMNSLPVDEIADRLQLPAGTVRGRLSRAYTILRRRLEAFMSGTERRGQVAPGGPPADDERRHSQEV